MKFTNELKEKIGKALIAKGAMPQCPRCSKAGLGIVDGFTSHQLQSDFNGMSFGGPMIPCVILGCGNCGYIILHAVGPLGITPDDIKRGVTND